MVCVSVRVMDFTLGVNDSDGVSDCVLVRVRMFGEALGVSVSVTDSLSVVDRESVSEKSSVALSEKLSDMDLTGAVIETLSESVDVSFSSDSVGDFDRDGMVLEFVFCTVRPVLLSVGVAFSVSELEKDSLRESLDVGDFCSDAEAPVSESECVAVALLVLEVVSVCVASCCEGDSDGVRVNVFVALRAGPVMDLVCVGDFADAESSLVGERGVCVTLSERVSVMPSV